MLEVVVRTHPVTQRVYEPLAVLMHIESPLNASAGQDASACPHRARSLVGWPQFEGRAAPAKLASDGAVHHLVDGAGDATTTSAVRVTASHCNLIEVDAPRDQQLLSQRADLFGLRHPRPRRPLPEHIGSGARPSNQVPDRIPDHLTPVHTERHLFDLERLSLFIIDDVHFGKARNTPRNRKAFPPCFDALASVESISLGDLLVDGLL